MCLAVHLDKSLWFFFRFVSLKLLVKLGTGHTRQWGPKSRKRKMPSRCKRSMWILWDEQFAALLGVRCSQRLISAIERFELVLIVAICNLENLENGC